MNTFSQLLQGFLGIGSEPKDLTFLQVSIRGIIVFVVTVIAVRLSTNRSLAEKTAFDAVLVVIIGSMLTRAINGSGSLPLWAADSSWCYCAGFSVWRLTSRTLLGS